MSEAVVFSAMPQSAKSLGDYGGSPEHNPQRPIGRHKISKDAEFISAVNDSVGSVASSLNQGAGRESVKPLSRLSQASSKLGGALSVLTSTVDIVQGVEQDNRNCDPYFTEATRAAGRAMGAVLLGGAATVAAGSIGLAAGPVLAAGVAIGLVGGAAAGAAIGDQLAQAFVWARKSWL